MYCVYRAEKFERQILLNKQLFFIKFCFNDPISLLYFSSNRIRLITCVDIVDVIVNHPLNFIQGSFVIQRPTCNFCSTSTTTCFET